MEIFTYLLLLLLVGSNIFLLYKFYFIKKLIDKQGIDQKKQMAEAGSAITETLKVAFDNLKKNTSDHNKINNKITEHGSRIHRIEQHISRTSKEFLQNKVSNQINSLSREKRGKIEDEN